MAAKTNLSVVIDIGTSKIAALAGQKTELGKLEILGSAKVSSKGIKRGVIFNIDEVAASIDIVLKQLESQLGESINRVNVAYAGQQMKTLDHQGYRFTSDEGVVTETDIDKLFDEAKNLKIEQDFKILHVIPQSFIIDEENSGLNPVGITGSKIEANYKLITIPEIQLINLQRVFDKIDVELGEITLSSLAVTEAVLTEDEKEIGAIVLDIGAGTTKLMVFHDGILIYAAVIPFGGSVITMDIKEGCSILLKWAEQLKVRYGEALGDFADNRNVVTIPGNNGWEPKEISIKSLAFIIQARLEEIIDNVYFQIEKSGIEGKIGSGIVITGGTSDLINIVSLVKFRTGMDARIAFSVIQTENKIEEIKSQEYFTALGLLKLTLNKKGVSKKGKKKRERSGFSNLVKEVVQGVLDYVDEDNEDSAMN
ncbi:MAG: cell division protein FtsA [Prolixibacteraceae bacterium]|jgi:cell division protein FtsA|nr:cell division protein FtsA [Prolixibacteraceae bacterium]MBT6764431.1 cell division protein FtsA [Prolixibacteraceae bacterium]MBT6997470.1 cell division protein FtsA [Prolixibacteraceae bacterium]MBT7395582.1 cell division protein FtsA [Prolixibacteraceae bacterium]